MIGTQMKTLSKSAIGSAVSLYFGNVMHARLKPKKHRFNYRIFSMLIDIDRLAEASGCSRIFSVNRKNLVSFCEKDHGKRDGSPLRPHIDQLLEKDGIAKPAKILLWCNPRVLGYAFNPLSIYYCYDDAGDVIALVYQVHNTFGESHSYVAKVGHNNAAHGSIRQSAEKEFYVSPFLDMNMRYDFRINPPDDTLRVRILEHDPEGPILSATFSGNRREMKTVNLLLGISQTLGLSYKIIAGIHIEALFIWLKGIKFRPRPKIRRPVTYATESRKMVPGE